MDKLLHEIAITALIIKDGKYLITKRSLSKKRFPRKWTVPGGKFYRYNVLEQALKREIKEPQYSMLELNLIK